YTRFEKARIIGARALQIAMGAPLLIKITDDVIDPLQLALMEFEKGVIPITVRRKGKLIKGPVV
ncbi:MAG: DNA-directed RNA polymerase subunit K, partial [Candidatus Thermoplasmatota archaeon]